MTQEEKTYQAMLFDDAGDLYFDGSHIGSRAQQEYEYDL